MLTFIRISLKRGITSELYLDNEAPVQLGAVVAQVDVGEDLRSVRSRYLCTWAETAATATNWSQKGAVFRRVLQCRRGSVVSTQELYKLRV